MGFFGTQKEKDIERLRRIIVNGLMREYKSETNPVRRRFIEAMAKSAALTPLEVFSGRQVLSEGIERRGDLFSIFQVRGQNVVGFFERIIGGKKEIVVEHKIQVPQLWDGKKLDPQKLMVVLHEFGHGAELYSTLPAMPERQKEQLADTLAVFTAKKLGFPARVIAQSLEGRQSIIGPEYHARLMQETFRKTPQELMRMLKRRPIRRTAPKALQGIKTVRLVPAQTRIVKKTGAKRPILSFTAPKRPLVSNTKFPQTAPFWQPQKQKKFPRRLRRAA